MKITVAIPTFNRQSAAIRTVREVLRVHNELVSEVILIDQTAPENWDEKCILQLNSWHDGGVIRLIRATQPNLPAARNVALLDARNEIVVFLDDDVLLSPGFFEAHLAAYNDPGIGGVAGQAFHRVAPIPLDCVETKQHAFGTAPHFATVETSIDWSGIMVGCNHSVRRRAALEASGYDANIVGGYYEDSDFSFRLRKAGWRIAYHPDAWLVHLRAPSGGCRMVHNTGFNERNKLIGYALFSFRHLRGRKRVSMLIQTFRAGPLRKENVINPWRWLGALRGFVSAVTDGYKLRNQVKGVNYRGMVS